MERSLEGLKKTGIYIWKWEQEKGIQFEYDIDSFLITQFNNILGELLTEENRVETETLIDFKWFKITVLERDKQECSMGGIIQDITEYKKQINKYQDLAFKDPLTGYFNRLGLNQVLEKYDFDNQIAAVLFIDLDNFKKLNDIYGHEAGDEMLVAVSKAIFRVIPSHAHLARVSGDEFIIFIENINDKRKLNKIAADILEAVIHSNDKSKMDDATITSSMGISLCPEHGEDYNHLISKADMAMYVAKKHGKAKFLYFNQEVEDDYYDYIRAHQTLLNAFKGNEFKLNYQPIYDLNNKKIEVFEVCPYWVHPSKGMIVYEQFLHTLYEEGLIFTFDEWMLEESIKLIDELKVMGMEIKLSINISPKHLALEYFHKNVEALLKKYHVHGSSIYIEMVEFFLMEDFETVNYNFKKLRELGCKIIIDGFGINQSTISVLKIMHFDSIKINKYFIETLGHEVSSEIILTTILRIAKENQKLFVADGVVNEMQFKILREIECEYAQGSYLSSPKPIEAIIDMIKRATKV